ncbi:MAG: thioredoxin domain-containing protein [Bacteroidota bacterium]
MRRVALALLVVLVAPPVLAQTAADSSSADAAWLASANAARTFGAGPNGSFDPGVPTIHEFADLACPTCRRAFETRIDSVKSLFVQTGRANFIVHAFPLPRLMRGPHAAEAMLCAGAIGGREGFSALQRHLYATQPDWRFLRDIGPHVCRAAAKAGLDPVDFDECIARDAMAPLIAADLRLGASLGASGTPTFVFMAPGAREPSDVFYGTEPLARYEDALALTLSTD